MTIDDVIHGLQQDKGGQPPASEDKSDKTVRDFIWLLFDTSSLASGFKLDEPTQFAGRIHRMINVGFSIDDGDEGLGDDDDLTPRKEVDGAADEASNMEEVETLVYVGAQNFAGCASWTIQDCYYFLGPGGAWVDIPSGLGLETLAPGCERHMQEKQSPACLGG